MLGAEVQEHCLDLFWRELKIKAVLHDSHELNKLDSAPTHHIDGLKEVPKVETVASHLRGQLHPQLLEDLSFVRGCCIVFIQARTGSKPLNDLFDYRVILHYVFLAHDL